MLFHLGKFRQACIHITLWAFYIFYESSLLLIVDDTTINIWETGLNFILYAGIFYANSLVILPTFLVKRKYLQLVVAIVLLFLVFVVMRYGMVLYILPLLDAPMQHPFANNRLFLAQSVWRGGYFFLLSLGYFFAVHSIATERQRRKLAEIRIEKEQQLRETETTLKELEISNLRNQINPHFLYNSLNILYSQVYPVSKKAAHGILLLSDIMRYALRDDASGKVMLEEEVQHLKNYIEMNQLRFNNSWQIRLDITGNLGFRMIIPLLLITFVENSFKHGDLLDPEHPLLIRIAVENDDLTFFIRNKKRKGEREKSTGLGLENTRKRLAITYPHAHTLDLQDETDFYTCVLNLKL